MLKRIPALLHALNSPIHRLPIVRAQHVQPQNVARPVLQQIMNGDEVAEALRHLFAFDIQEAVVHPNARKRPAMVDGLRLGNLILVMRKNEIDPSAVDVESLAKKGLAHGGALEMPSRSSESIG